MAIFTGGNVYEKLDVRRVINAMGNQTVLGGSSPSEAVREAMEYANSSYVEMRELLEKSGEFISKTLGTEAGYVTSGCAAALALSAAACMTGEDPEKIFQLPDTRGLKNEILIQKKQRYSYDRCYTVTGAKLVEVGDENGCTAQQLEDAIGPDTAAVAYFIQPDWDDSVVSLDEAVSIAHSKDVPVIADAASQNYPLDSMLDNATSADLVCFGAKYFGAPHSTGFVCGKKNLVDAAVANGFIGFHTGGRKAIGRPLKVSRQDVIAVVAALDEWFTMNHEDRLISIDNRLTAMQKGLRGIPNVEAEVVRHQKFWGASLQLVLDPALGKTPQDVARELDEGNPRIWVNPETENTITVNAHTLKEGEEAIVVEKLRESLFS
jgi:uncharacterized pyridoxal phosphate-dependent enzyme